jgi:hypothetical protein
LPTALPRHATSSSTTKTNYFGSAGIDCNSTYSKTCYRFAPKCGAIECLCYTIHNSRLHYLHNYHTPRRHRDCESNSSFRHDNNHKCHHLQPTIHNRASWREQRTSPGNHVFRSTPRCCNRRNCRIYSRHFCRRGLNLVLFLSAY